MQKIYVIGIGYKPLDKRAKDIIAESGFILASNRLFDVFKRYEEFEAVKKNIKVINNVDETLKVIHSSLVTHHSSPIVLLASGDPMFFGIGRRALNEFGKNMVEIIPDLSSMQLAFSKIKEPWDDAFPMSLHGGPDPAKRRKLPYEIDDIPSLLQRHNKIAILTDRENNPSAIADVVARSKATKQSKDFEIASPEPAPGDTPRFLANARNDMSERARNDSIRMYVCERLGYADEKITEGTAAEIAGMSFSEPNVVIIKNTGNNPPACPFVKGGTGGFPIADNIRFGIKEGEILHSRGLITKDEIRAVTVHKLSLPVNGVLWDIGAGSGSVSIEAARLCPQLKIYAVEKDPEQLGIIRKNKTAFNLRNIEIIEGSAPDAIKNLPAPDRVFIGGSGGKLEGVLNAAAAVMASGIVVINAATIETLNAAIRHLESAGFATEVSQVSISRSKIIGGKMHMSALNPVFIITGWKTRLEDVGLERL